LLKITDDTLRRTGGHMKSFRTDIVFIVLIVFITVLTIHTQKIKLDREHFKLITCEK